MNGSYQIGYVMRRISLGRFLDRIEDDIGAEVSSVVDCILTERHSYFLRQITMAKQPVALFEILIQGWGKILPVYLRIAGINRFIDCRLFGNGRIRFVEAR